MIITQATVDNYGRVIFTGHNTNPELMSWYRPQSFPLLPHKCTVYDKQRRKCASFPVELNNQEHSAV